MGDGSLDTGGEGVGEQVATIRQMRVKMKKRQKQDTHFEVTGYSKQKQQIQSKVVRVKAHCPLPPCVNHYIYPVELHVFVDTALK